MHFTVHNAWDGYEMKSFYVFLILNWPRGGRTVLRRNGQLALMAVSQSTCLFV